MDKTKIPLTLEQATALRAMIKLEAVSRMADSFIGSLKERADSTDFAVAQAAIGGVLGDIDTWMSLDHPIRTALQNVNEGNLRLDLPLEIEADAATIELYALIIHSGIYNRGIDLAKKGAIDKGQIMPLVLMERNKAILSEKFPVPPEDNEGVAKTAVTFPVFNKGGFSN